MNSKTVFTNLLWRFAERSGAQLVKFCVELILARLLLPDDYGLIAFKFLIGILEGIASNLPSLIKAGVDVLVAFFAGIVDALRGIDTGALLKSK